MLLNSILNLAKPETLKGKKTLFANAPAEGQKVNHLSREFAGYQANQLGAGYTAGLLQQYSTIVLKQKPRIEERII